MDVKLGLEQLLPGLVEKLNPQQRAAVEAVDGPLLILAGAGSGKTRVITHRIAYLIEERGVAPDSILAVTFTNKAAAEMAERVDRLLDHSSLAKPLISTFHSFCVRVLRRDIEQLRIGDQGLTRNFAIYDETDQQAVVKQAMRRMGLDPKQLTPKIVLSRISWAKNHMLDPQEVYLESKDPISERVAHVYEAYRKELARANALDFDDLLLEAVRLLKVSEETRERYHRHFRYLLIDEYQDTNRPQYELMKLLAGEKHNVCVVGDEDQSIYSWRGADIRNILEFERDFPEAKTVRLEQNYRSTGIILKAASAVVARNQMRKGKTLWTARQGGAKIGYYEAPDGENEALFIADYIQRFQRMHGTKTEPPRAAVLYRTNAQSRLMEEALRRYGIEYTMVGGFSFYERAEIKDLLSYLRLIENPHDSIALARVINTPARGIGKTTVELLDRLSFETGMSTWSVIGRALDEQLVPQRARAALAGFRRLIEDARALVEPGFAEKLEADLEQDHAENGATEEEPDATNFDFGEAKQAAPPIDPARADPGVSTARPDAEIGENAPFRTPGGAATLPEIIRFLIDRSGYIRALELEGTPEAISRIENLKELANAAQDAQQRGETLAEFLDHAALVSDTDQYQAAARVTLMSLHAAKGLEFPLVMLAGMEEGLFPHSRTLNNPQDLEEERRLCYVGMTRAMDVLVLTRARYRRRYGNDLPEASIASRFLEEIPEDLIEDLSPGHAASGEGRSDYGSAYSESSRKSRGNAYAYGFRYEDEDQSRTSRVSERPASALRKTSSPPGLRNGQRVRHPKYGEGIVFAREGEGDDARITVQFREFGKKELVEKFAQLERIR